MRRLGAAIEPPEPANEDDPLDGQGAAVAARAGERPEPAAQARRARITFYSVAEFVLLALLALQCARLFWTLIVPLGPVGNWTAPVPPPLVAPGQPAALDFDPFFRTGSAPGPVVVTSLDLSLHGVREDRATGGGSAIIGTPDGRQGSYQVGEEIVPGVVLTGVALDGVTISRQGRTERIFLAPAMAEPQTTTPGSPGTPPGGASR